MNRFSLILTSLLFAVAGLTQEEKIAYNILVDSIYSNAIQDDRKIKIYLPKDYSEDEKYPVIYTLDGEWMFEPSVATTKMLTDFTVIPQTIVVGILHKNRYDDLGMNWQTGAFSKKGLDFYRFLTTELIPKINSTYTTSGFNVLIGHSNSATYSQKVLTQAAQPFSGIIALSQNLFGNQLQDYIDFKKKPTEKQVFYFVASGTRDATPRIESGLALDSIFLKKQHAKLKEKHVMYDADHMGIAAKGLNNGISFVFSEYRHYNDWDDQLIDSLLAKGYTPLSFIHEYSKNIKAIYGVDFKASQDDIYLMQTLAQNDDDIETVQQYELDKFGKSNEFYSIYAQCYESIRSYSKALEYWEKNLEEEYDRTNFFYYRRPIQLIYKKMNQPEKAIEFAEKWKGRKPKLALNFDLWIAKIASESGVQRKKGLDAIRSYIQNYSDNLPMDLEEARQIEQNLLK